MRHFFFILSIALFASCSTAQHYSTKSKKAIKLFEQGKEAPRTSIDKTTNMPNFKLGLKYLDQAIEKDPNFWEAHMVAGEFAETLRDYEPTLAYIKLSIHDPDSISQTMLHHVMFRNIDMLQ